MKAVGGFILICVGAAILWYEFRTNKEAYGIKKSWQTFLMLILEIIGEGVATIGLLLIVVGIILVLVEVL